MIIQQVNNLKILIKKILVNAEIREGRLGNCVPLEQIPILSVSSRKAVEHIINFENVTYNETDNGVEDSDFTESFLEEHQLHTFYTS
jgi:hypothetical protein